MMEKQVIRDFLATLLDKDVWVSDDDSLLATRLLDSLKVVELVAFLERHYQTTFDSEELIPDNLDSINAIASFLERKGVA